MNAITARPAHLTMARGWYLHFNLVIRLYSLQSICFILTFYDRLCFIFRLQSMNPHSSSLHAVKSIFVCSEIYFRGQNDQGAENIIFIQICQIRDIQYAIQTFTVFSHYSTFHSLLPFRCCDQQTRWSRTYSPNCRMALSCVSLPCYSPFKG